MKSRYAQIISTFDRLSGIYGARRGMEEVNRLALASYVAAWRGRVLDVGCGAGNFIEKYVSPGRHEIYTIDFSLPMIEETRKRLQSHIGTTLFPACATAQSMPFLRDGFDGVVCVNTLHNMPSWADIREALAEMARVLRPRGLLLIELRNSNNPGRREITIAYDKPELPQKSFTFDEVAEALTGLGFEIEKGVPLSGDNPEKGFASKILRRVRTRASRLTVDNAPRFAIIARKGPGFNSALQDALGERTT